MKASEAFEVSSESLKEQNLSLDSFFLNTKSVIDYRIQLASTSGKFYVKVSFDDLLVDGKIKPSIKQIMDLVSHFITEGYKVSKFGNNLVFSWKLRR